MALLGQKLAPPPSEPAPDRAPDGIAGGVAQPLRGELEELLGPDRVLARAGDIVRYASDASPYRLLLKAIVMARDTGDIAKVFGYARRTHTPVVLRGGGTSLNGQAQTDGILLDVRRHWRRVHVPDARRWPRLHGPGQARDRWRPPRRPAFSAWRGLFLFPG